MVVAFLDLVVGCLLVCKFVVLGGFAFFGVVIVKELCLLLCKRIWNGCFGLFFYDLCLLMFDRVCECYWNLKGLLLLLYVFGVGWTINFGKFVLFVRGC